MTERDRQIMGYLVVAFFIAMIASFVFGLITP